MHPLYDYKCTVCGTLREVRHAMSERPDLFCEVEGCEGQHVQMKKLIGKPTIVYHGEGWTQKESANKAAGIPKEVAKTAERLGRL